MMMMIGIIERLKNENKKIIINDHGDNFDNDDHHHHCRSITLELRKPEIKSGISFVHG